MPLYTDRKAFLKDYTKRLFDSKPRKLEYQRHGLGRFVILPGKITVLTPDELDEIEFIGEKLGFSFVEHLRQMGIK